MNYSILLALFLALVLLAIYIAVVIPYRNPLYGLAGPPITKWFGNHMGPVLDPAISNRGIDIIIRRYGRSVRIRGIGSWDDRLLTLDPLSLAHVLKTPEIYEKPWQSRRIIENLIGRGILAAEGQMHKRHRRVASPAFSVQNLRALVPLVFRKGTQLKDRIAGLVDDGSDQDGFAVLDIAHWVSRATFDIIGVAGFDYNFNAIENEENELFLAYKDMFEISLSQGKLWRTLLGVWAPAITRWFPDKIERTVNRCVNTIHTTATKLVLDRKDKVLEGQRTGKPYPGKDLLTLLIKSNLSTSVTPAQRISDEDMIHNINTFMFAGSDTSSLSLAWTFLLLAQHPTVQSRLRAELFALLPQSQSEQPDLTNLATDEIHSLYEQVANLPYLHNVVRESMRLIPPVHSSLRVATQDDQIPVAYPVHMRDGSVKEDMKTVPVKKGTYVHVSIEAFNLDKEVWGPDAWEFNPDRWDALPDRVDEQPGLFSNILTFSAGPRSCIGMRFSMIEVKSFLFILLTNFEFVPTEDRIIKANVVLTRPYVAGKYADGSQLPVKVRRLARKENAESEAQS